MPRYDLMTNENMTEVTTVNNYKFSKVRIDHLEASEYTLVSIHVDVSMSLCGYEKDLEEMLINIQKANKKAGVSENVLTRVTVFGSTEDEIHGFRPFSLISDIDAEYKGKTDTHGATLLYDTIYRSLEATEATAADLRKSRFGVNAVIFAITDGCDNMSTYTAKSIADKIAALRKNEALDSIALVLIKMTGDSSVKQVLSDFAKDATFDADIDFGDASSGSIAKIAGYVSQSVSSTHSQMGYGMPSQSLQI